MKLNYKQIGEGPPLVILHGLLGMLDNWMTPAKALAKNHQVYVVDQRNHGRSGHDSEMNYALMADDLEELLDDLFLEEINLLGHSMGGKTAMKFTQRFPDRVLKLVVADIGPKHYEVHHQQILEGLFDVDLTKVKSRQEVENVLSQYIPEITTRQFLMRSLYWESKGQLAWRYNIKAIKENIGRVGEETLDGICETPTLFIRGGNSNYIIDEDRDLIESAFPNYCLETIKNAGHWLHVEQPELFVNSVNGFLL